MAGTATPGRRVRVAVEALADRPERAFSYVLPASLGDPAAGSLLLVPYGRRLALGYLLADADDEAPAELREVEAVVSEPMLTAELLTVAEHVAAYYRAPLGTTIASMLPPGLESRLQRRWRVVDVQLLPDAVRAAFGAGDEADDAALRRAAGPRGAATLERLRRAGALAPSWSLNPPQLRARRVRTVRCLPGDHRPPRRAPLQEALLAALGSSERTLLELAADMGVEPGALDGPARRLAERGVVELRWRAVERDPLAHRPRAAPRDHSLADEQVRALAQIEGLAAGGELLLEGVAAAGKTDLYLAAVEAAVARGGSAIVLVPELSLIPQLADRVAALVGDGLAVLHSGLSAGERHDTWWRILRGAVRVVVGTRMAVFAPLANLALIVVDEAHDGGYKSDRTPRLDARWVARQRAALTGARLVLGSATPDVVTISRVRGGLVERARLVERRVGSPPAVHLVDMRAELVDGNRSIFSRALLEALALIGQAGEPGNSADEPPRCGHLHPVPRLRREPALPRLRPALRLPPVR